MYYVRGVGSISSCLLLSFLLLRTRYVRYLMAIWWMIFIVTFLMSDVGICRFSRSSMLLVWMAPLTLAVITMRGLIFQSCALIASTNGLHLSSFVCMSWSRNLSCIKVDSIIWMVRSGVGISGPFCSYAAPRVKMIPGLSFARHSHHVVLHVQLSIHGRMVLSWWLPCWLLALMSVRCLV